MVAQAMPLDSPADDDEADFVASDEDLHQAWLNALQIAGFSYEELAEQARTGAFETASAHRAWHIVKSLLPWREPPTRD
ncbi:MULTISPECIES: hypothetical protein [unclassified Pseudofrankia]|uniref:hypothetical protein n=1 Tax=unclassified Pseudofrankia TaxID=2994372 RepID=UPI0009F21752|nr:MULTISPECIES: hypothetical protein [unclassified Pseudofrankia]MDT3441190.1 hypothetical protein [Pseudofrankia sp. BMG5.37]